MPQSLNIKLRGLYTFPNDFSSIPEGALSVADNIVIDRDSIAEPRRGFTCVAATGSNCSPFQQSTGKAVKIFFFKNRIMMHYVTTVGDYRLAYFDPTTGWNDIGGGGALYNPPTATTKVRVCQSNQNQYLTGARSVFKQETYSSVPTYTGVSEALQLLTSYTTGASQWLKVDNICSYRLVWGIKDANNNEILGAPCGATTLQGDNASTAYGNIRARIPFGITVNHFYRLYRSFQFDNTSGTVSPPDRQYQVYEGYPSSADVNTNHYVDIVDVCPEALFGAELYTNDTQQGSAMANMFPPRALDICSYRDSMFYGNLLEQQILFLTYSGGLADTNKITICGLEMTAKLSPTPSTTQFQLYAGSDGTSIRKTCQAMLDIFNTSMSSGYDGAHGSYISSFTDLPGKMVFRTNTIGSSAFAATAASAPIGKLFIPALPTSGTTISSTADTSPNGLAYSKPYQPEHVPLPHRIYVGSKDSAILRIIPLRDSLFILKEDGVWRLFGTDPSNFQVALLDSTARCIAPDAAVVLNNMIFALTTQGVVTISDTGVTIMSRPIEGDILDLQSITPTVLYNESFAVSYESQRAYYLWVPTLAADTLPTQYYRYNTVTNNWTRGTLSKRCGGVNPADDRLYLGHATAAYMDVEMKTLTSFDYADFVSLNSISGVSGVTVTIAAANLLKVGQVIYQSDLLWGEISSLVDSAHVKMKYAVAFTNAEAQILDPISVNIKWAPCTFANPGINKQVREISILMLNDFYGVGNVSFESDISPEMEEEDCIGIASGPWGQFPWGGAPWGGNAPRRRPLRVGVPRNHQRCSFLTVGFNQDVCFSPWAIQGVSLIGNNISERVWMEGDTV